MCGEGAIAADLPGRGAACLKVKGVRWVLVCECAGKVRLLLTCRDEAQLAAAVDAVRARIPTPSGRPASLTRLRVALVVNPTLVFTTKALLL